MPWIGFPDSVSAFSWVIATTRRLLVSVSLERGGS